MAKVLTIVLKTHVIWTSILSLTLSPTVSVPSPTTTLTLSSLCSSHSCSSQTYKEMFLPWVFALTLPSIWSSLPVDRHVLTPWTPSSVQNSSSFCSLNLLRSTTIRPSLSTSPTYSAPFFFSLLYTVSLIQFVVYHLSLECKPHEDRDLCFGHCGIFF